MKIPAFIPSSLFIVSLLMLFACSNNVEEITSTEEKQIKVSLSLKNNDILITDEPLFSKSRSEDEFTYAVQVSVYNANTSNYENYAHGVFDSKDIEINLTEGKKYIFEVALFKNFFNSGQILSAYHDTDIYYYSANNKFTYNNMIISQMHGGISSPFQDKDNGAKRSKFMGETFYGKTVDYIAEVNAKVEINLSRVSTYLNVIVNGMTEGKVVSTDMGMDFSIEYPTTTYSTWITDSKYMNGEESFLETLLLKYISPDNEETTLVYQNFTFKRNYKKSIILNLKPATPSEIDSKVSLNISESELETDENSTFECEI